MLKETEFDPAEEQILIWHVQQHQLGLVKGSTGYQHVGEADSLGHSAVGATPASPDKTQDEKDMENIPVGWLISKEESQSLNKRIEERANARLTQEPGAFSGLTDEEISRQLFPELYDPSWFPVQAELEGNPVLPPHGACERAYQLDLVDVVNCESSLPKPPAKD
ncbi:MAG: hypothetical protein GY700_12470 [Propionibacteriaceae bacterium]|nr:hypothetical protein [Propionibacteriaceae bacterium]